MVFYQLVVAVLLLILTLSLQCVGVAGLIEWRKRVAPRDTPSFGPIRSAALVVESSVAIIILHGLVILLWAGFYRTQCFSSWELAFYFSASSYATVGYGDVVLPSNWCLLGPLESVTGVLMCGVSVCLLFSLVSHLVDTAMQSSPENKRRGAPSSFAAQSSQRVGEQTHA